MSSEPPTSGSSDETAATPVSPAMPAGSDDQPTYGMAQPTLGEPGAGYGAGQATYGTSQPGYGTDQPPYGSPQPSYGDSSPDFGPPSGSPHGSPGGDERPSYRAQPTTGWWGASPASTPSGYDGRTGSGFHTSDTRSAAGDFLSKLFDLSFTSAVTPSAVKVVYVIAMALIALGWLVYSVVGFARSPVLGLLFLVVIGPVVSLVYLVVVRICLELSLAVVRLAEDVRELKLKQQ
ncbi:MAG: DUF4282 domain-containing protein [Actinomycetota bacterium]|nr:DUF4282 domain-containing protein [Actinomycetota bacterium]